MAVSIKEQKDNLVILEAKLTEVDYKEKVEKEIKNLSKKVALKGFRKGHTPVGIVKKMYGESVRRDVIQSLISDSVVDFMNQEGLHTIGQPMPLIDETSQKDPFESEEVTILLEQALFPEIKNKLTTSDTVDYYKTVISDEMVEDEYKKLISDHKVPVDVDSVDEDAIVSGIIAELDGDLPKEGGITSDHAMLFPKYMKDEEEKSKFMGVGMDAVVVFNPYKAFEGDTAELTSLLKIEKEEVDNYKNTEFSFQINKISSIREPEINQDFFDRAFGEDTVHNEEEARQKVREGVSKEEEGNANYLFLKELKDLVHAEKLGDIKLAEETILRWFKSTPKGEQLAKDGSIDGRFHDMMETLKEELFFKEYAKEYDVKVSEEDIKNYAIRYTWQQFANMGWPNAPMNVLEQQAKALLDNQDFVYATESEILQQLVAAKLRENNVITIVEKEISPEELHNLISQLSKSDNSEEAVNQATENETVIENSNNVSD